MSEPIDLEAELYKTISHMNSVAARHKGVKDISTTVAYVLLRQDLCRGLALLNELEKESPPDIA